MFLWTFWIIGDILFIPITKKSVREILVAAKPDVFMTTDELIAQEQVGLVAWGHSLQAAMWVKRTRESCCRGPNSPRCRASAHNPPSARLRGHATGL
jgi:hypothetical protein